MSKLLCIAIPTYNRAAALDRQLETISRTLAGHEASCQLVISDNASSDYTPEVVERWRSHFVARGVPFDALRNARNMGPLPNIRQCIARADARFTWVVGDDDQVSDRALPWLVDTLTRDPDLASVVMNFSTSGASTLPRCFDFGGDLNESGRAVVTRCLQQRPWGLAFITAQVYRTEYAQAAYWLWPEGASNYDYQIFITAAVALQGRSYATQEVLVDYVTGQNVYHKDPRINVRLMADTLEVFVRLRELGIPTSLIRAIAREHLTGIVLGFGRQALRVNPRYSIRTLLRMAAYTVEIARMPRDERAVDDDAPTAAG
jgi:glycosyltransferase involved in cell wall biosynthesis